MVSEWTSERGKIEDSLLGREWKREDGTGMKIDRCFVDSSYEMDTIFEAVRSSPYAGVLMPSNRRSGSFLHASRTLSPRLDW